MAHTNTCDLVSTGIERHQLRMQLWATRMLASRHIQVRIHQHTVETDAVLLKVNLVSP